MADVPNTLMFNFVDTPASIQFNAGGEGFVLLNKTSAIIDVTGFRRASIRIGSTKATAYAVFMGKISGATLSMRSNLPLDGNIHTLEVVGPEMNLVLTGGPPNSKDKVQLWVYLRS